MGSTKALFCRFLFCCYLLIFVSVFRHRLPPSSLAVFSATRCFSSPSFSTHCLSQLHVLPLHSASSPSTKALLRLSFVMVVASTRSGSGSDEDIDPDPIDAEEPVTIPVLRRSPRTRAGVKSIREEFNQSIEGLITLMEHEELKETLLTTEISQETPRLNKVIKETDQDDTKVEQGAQAGVQEQLKISSTPFLPVLQGTKETCLFIITKQMEAHP